jgi:hypothetical protein
MCYVKNKKYFNVFLINSFFVKTIFNIVILFFQLNTFFFLCFVLLIFFIPETNHCTNAILKHRIVEAQVCISIKEVLKYILQ